MNKFKIHAALSPYDSWIEVDGKRLDGVVSLRLTMNADRAYATTLHLEVMGEVEVEGEFRNSEILVLKRIG